MRKFKALLLLAAAFSAGNLEAAFPLKGMPEQGSVNFLAVGRPSLMKIHGKAPGPESNLTLDGNRLLGSADFSLESLDTGIALRNEHMKEKYLQVGEHPKATLTLTEALLDNGETLTAAEKPFKGKLKLHGQEKEVEGKFSAASGLVKASFQIKLTDYGIRIPSYLGITVAETVDVNVELPLKKE